LWANELKIAQQADIDVIKEKEFKKGKN